MGNKIRKNTIKKITELLTLVFFLAALSLFILVTFNKIQNFFGNKQRHVMTYNPSIDTKKDYRVGISDEAIGIPVLMYHGVTKDFDTVNTTRDSFIRQMEALKAAGYQTIKIDDLYEYIKEKKEIPDKSFLITFDDGRKDSYYPTTEVLKKLGFTAVLFEATGPTLDGNNFYLTYAELSEAAKSGVWEIQAHGRNSHKKISNGPNDSHGRYLTSRIYKDGQLETVEEYYKRVEQDYVDNIHDIEKLLGYTPRYIAIPLNDYGYNDSSNISESLNFNREVVKKHFDMAFIQANDTVKILEFYEKYYNSPGDDPYTIKRIEVQNMSPEDLLKILKDGKPEAMPKEWKLNTGKVNSDTKVQYGNVSSVNGFHVIKTNPGEESAKIYYGDNFWKDYTVEAELRRVSGRSASLLFRVNKDTNISFGVTDNGLFLRQVIDNNEKSLMPSVLVSPGNKVFTLKVEVRGNRLNAYYNGHLYYQNVIIRSPRGHVGIKLWSDTSIPIMEIRKLEVRKIEQ